MSNLHTKLVLEVEVLSPLHIGAGSTLLLGYDLVVHSGRTYRVDEDVLLDQSLLAAQDVGKQEINRLLLGRPAAELLDESSFANPDSSLFRYVLDGVPSKEEGEIGEQVKDVRGRLYLPGSSLKGALRTLLAWGIYHDQDRKPRLDQLEHRRRSAADPLERELFGQNPNLDWLRALQVGDSQPLRVEENLALHTVRVFPTAQDGSSGLDVDVEAVEPGTVFQTQIAVETYGFESAEAAELGWQGKRLWIRRLPLLGKEHARESLLIEAQYFRARGGPLGALRFYDELVHRLLDLPTEAFLAQVGWGSGWESKTLGSGLLRQDDVQFEKLISQYQMTKEESRQPGDPFPRSRHLALVDGRPALPMGWVEVRVAGLEALEVTEAPVKAPEAAPGQRTGRLARFFPDRRFGFIEPDTGGKDIFVHESELVEPLAKLRPGQKLAFDVEQAEKGPRAVNVRVLG